MGSDRVDAAAWPQPALGHSVVTPRRWSGSEQSDAKRDRQDARNFQTVSSGQHYCHVTFEF